jgi:hypothetical protein
MAMCRRSKLLAPVVLTNHDQASLFFLQNQGARSRAQN